MDDGCGAQALAEASAARMWAADQATQGLGAELLEVGPGRAVLTMAVGPAMVNGHGMAHGGFIFALADSAFAFACNTYGSTVVAQHCAITFLRPARLGDRLTARAVETARTGRTGIYDVEVTGAGGKPVALFRGHSRVIEERPAADVGAEDRGARG